MLKACEKNKNNNRNKAERPKQTENIRRQFRFNLGYHKNATWANNDGIDTNLKYT